MMDRVAEDIDVDFLSASKCLLTFPDRETALAVHDKYNGYRFGKSRFKVELHLSKPYPTNRLGVGRYVKKVSVCCLALLSPAWRVGEWSGVFGWLVCWLVGWLVG